MACCSRLVRTFVLLAASSWIIAVTGCGSTGVSVGTNSGNSATQLTAAPSALDFGTTTVGTPSTKSLIITASGSGTVTVSQINVTGAGFGVTGASLPLALAPGQSATLNVSVNPQSAGTVSGGLSILSNASNSPTSATLTSTASAPAAPALSLNPTSVSFGSVNLGSSSTKSVIVSNNGTASLTISQATASGAGYSISGITLPATLVAGASTSFSVSFAPSASGTANGSVSFVTNASSTPASLPLTGTGAAAPLAQLTANPAAASFGKVTVGSSGNQSVSVINSGNVSVTISQIAASGTGFSAGGVNVPLTLSPGQSSTYSAQFAPTVTGNASGQITVTSNASNSPTAISLSGTGVAAPTPQLTVNVTSLSFGNVTVGNSSTKSVTLSNSGDANLTISQITTSGTGFSGSSVTLPLTLVPGQTANYTAQFAPSATGTASGQISFTSNSPTNPTVSLSGTGVAAPILQLSVSQNSLAFGNVTVGNNSSQSVVLTNTGNANITISQVTITGTGFSGSGITAPLTLTPGQTANYTAQFAPNATGNASGQISFTSNASNSPTTVSLTGTGVAATVLQLTANPPTVNFGNVNVGSTATQSVAITNTGNANVTISQITPSGSGFSGSGMTVPSTLTPGQSASYTVTFTPMSGGSFPGQVSFASDAASSPTVSLTGTGVAPPPQLNISTNSLASATVGQAYSATLTAVGGTPAYTWSLASGSLPPGLILAATNGQITGTASTAGSYTMTFQVTDSGSPGQSTTKSLTITVNNVAVSGSVAAYAFCEGTGTTTADFSANGNLGTIYGATWTVSGKFGHGLLFNGAGNYVEAADTNFLTPGANGTFEAWISLNSTPTETASVFNKWNQSLDDEYIFGLSPTQKLYFAWQTTGGLAWGTPSYNEIVGTGAIPLQTLTHVAVVRTTGTLDFYINGNLDFSISAMDANPFRNGANSLRLGGQGRGLMNRYFNGVIDQVRLYDRALSQAEIQNDMNTPISTSCLAPLSIAASSLPGATVGVPYSAPLSASGGTPPYTWSLAGGSLPTGLTLSAAGVISGTPVATGVQTFTAQVTDSVSQTRSQAFTLSTTSATGPQFYVATTGNDANSGTSPSTPWRTVQKAMNSATAGSTVNIVAGIYNERLMLAVSGTAGNYITFQPNGFSVPAGGCGGYTGVQCGGDQVILDYAYLGTVSDGVPFLHISNQSYVRIQGLTFQNFTTHELGLLNQGVRVDGSSSYVEFKYNKFLNNKDTGPHDGTSAFAHFRVWGPANNIWVFGNELGNIWSNYSEALTADSGAINFIVEKNWIHDTDAIAIDLHGGTNNYTIRGNRLDYISLKRDGTIWYGSPSAAIYNDGANTGIMEGNFLSHAGVGFQALSEPGMQATHDVTIRNNIAEYCETGIVLGTWYSNVDGSSVSNINVFNNTFYGNSTGLVVRPMVSATVAWENNIFANNTTTYVNTLGWNPGNVNYNVYFGGGTGPGGTVLTSDPLFVNAAAGNYTLQVASPAINSGDPSTPGSIVGPVDYSGNARLLGGRIDIGAYEMR